MSSNPSIPSRPHTPARRSAIPRPVRQSSFRPRSIAMELSTSIQAPAYQVLSAARIRELSDRTDNANAQIRQATTPDHLPSTSRAEPFERRNATSSLSPTQPVTPAPQLLSSPTPSAAQSSLMSVLTRSLSTRGTTMATTPSTGVSRKSKSSTTSLSRTDSISRVSSHLTLETVSLTNDLTPNSPTRYVYSSAQTPPESPASNANETTHSDLSASITSLTDGGFVQGAGSFLRRVVSVGRGTGRSAAAGAALARANVRREAVLRSRSAMLEPEAALALSSEDIAENRILRRRSKHMSSSLSLAGMDRREQVLERAQIAVEEDLPRYRSTMQQKAANPGKPPSPETGSNPGSDLEVVGMTQPSSPPALRSPIPQVMAEECASDNPNTFPRGPVMGIRFVITAPTSPGVTNPRFELQSKGKSWADMMDDDDELDDGDDFFKRPVAGSTSIERASASQAMSEASILMHAVSLHPFSEPNNKEEDSQTPGSSMRNIASTIRRALGERMKSVLAKGVERRVGR